MSNMPSIDNTRMTFRMPISLRAKMRKKMRDSNGTMTENDIVLLATMHELENVVPDPQDVRWAQEERKRNERRRKEQR